MDSTPARPRIVRMNIPGDDQFTVTVDLTDEQCFRFYRNLSVLAGARPGELTIDLDSDPDALAALDRAIDGQSWTIPDGGSREIVAALKSGPAAAALVRGRRLEAVDHMTPSTLRLVLAQVAVDAPEVFDAARFAAL